MPSRAEVGRDGGSRFFVFCLRKGQYRHEYGTVYIARQTTGHRPQPADGRRNLLAKPRSARLWESGAGPFFSFLETSTVYKVHVLRTAHEYVWGLGLAKVRVAGASRGSAVSFRRSFFPLPLCLWLGRARTTCSTEDGALRPKFEYFVPLAPHCLWSWVLFPLCGVAVPNGVL